MLLVFGESTYFVPPGLNQNIEVAVSTLMLKNDWNQKSNISKTVENVLRSAWIMEYNNLDFSTSCFRVRSFERIPIRISDMWRSFRADPFSDQWSLESTLHKDSSDHWSEWSANGSSDQWSGAFLWVKDPKLITVRSGFGLELHMYFMYEIQFRVRSTAFVLW